MRTPLLTALRTTIAADSDPVRQTLFARLRATSTPVRAVCWLHERLGRGPMSSVLVAMYGIKSWLTMNRRAGERGSIVAVAVHANARRRIEQVARTYGPDRVDLLAVTMSELFRPSTIARLLRLSLAPRSMGRSLRVVGRMNRRYDFLVSCRVASVLGCYSRAKQLLMSARPAGVLVSSDSNPEEVGLVAAARSLSIPTVFVSHAYTTTVSPRLNFSLSILEGEAAVEAYSRKGPVAGTIFLGGVEGVSKPMDPSRLRCPEPAIGFFAPKVVVWPVFSAMIDDCRRHFRARQVIIRWHPSMLEHPVLPKVLNDPSNIVETPRSATLVDIASLCDWVVADAGSNVHLPVLKQGIPTVALEAISTLGEDRADLYGFVANRVVFPPVATLRSLCVDDAAAFYGEEWTERFRRYDASYLQPEEMISADLRAALRTVFDDGSSRSDSN